LSIFYPTAAVRRVTDITVELLKGIGVRALALDVDNTLTTHNNPIPDVKVMAWLAKMREAEISMIILSNNSKDRVLPFARQLRLDFVARGAKPLPFGYARTAKELGIPKGELAVVGDQIFTDVLGGNLYGAKSILVEPMYPEEGPLFRLKRRWEVGVLRRYHAGKSK
jgi:HAD superfamily phosphatase (TIGR01668 family)